MYRLVILSIVVVTAVVAIDKKECEKLFDCHSIGCCKKSSEIKNKILEQDGVKECLQLPKDPVKCEHEICLAKTRGFATDDGKLDRKKLEEVLSKDLKAEPELLELVKTKCINADIEKYGQPDFCEFTKMKTCLIIHLLERCNDWSDTGNCKDIKAVIGDCVKVIEGSS